MPYDVDWELKASYLLTCLKTQTPGFVEQAEVFTSFNQTPSFATQRKLFVVVFLFVFNIFSQILQDKERSLLSSFRPLALLNKQRFLRPLIKRRALQYKESLLLLLFSLSPVRLCKTKKRPRCLPSDARRCKTKEGFYFLHSNPGFEK